MRYRILRGGSARRFGFDRRPQPAPCAPPPAPSAAALQNPYRRCYGSARSREELRRARRKKGEEE